MQSINAEYDEYLKKRSNPNLPVDNIKSKKQIPPSSNVLIPLLETKPKPSRNLLIPADDLDPDLLDEEKRFLAVEGRRLIEGLIPAPVILPERLRAHSDSDGYQKRPNPYIPVDNDKPNEINQPSSNVLIPRPEAKPKPPRTNPLVPADDPDPVLLEGKRMLTLEGRRFLERGFPPPQDLLDRLIVVYANS